MKKVFVLLLSALFSIVLVSCGEAEEVKNDNDNEKKLNNAMSCIESGNYEEAYALFKELGDYADAAQQRSRFYYVFEKSDTYFGGELDSSLTVSLNDDNLPVKMVTTFKNGNQSVEEYVYDENANMVRHTLTRDDNYHQVTENYYDGDGKNIRTILNENNGDKLFITPVYDETGRKIETIYAYADGSVQSVVRSEYDENGNVIKAVISYTDGTPEFYIDYVYDTNGNLIEERQYNADQTQLPAGEPKVPEQGEEQPALGDSMNNVAWDNFEVTVQTNDFFYSYDSEGKLIKKTTKDHDSGVVIYVYEYVYDENSNIVKRVFDEYNVCTEYSYKLVYIPCDLPESTKRLLKPVIA